jgi:hypothetical protein
MDQPTGHLPPVLSSFQPLQCICGELCPAGHLPLDPPGLKPVSLVLHTFLTRPRCYSYGPAYRTPPSSPVVNKKSKLNYLDNEGFWPFSVICTKISSFEKKTESKKFLFSLYPFLTFFSHRVLETDLGGLKAAWIGPALSKFRPSIGGEAT